MRESIGSAKLPCTGLCVCLLLWGMVGAVQAAPEPADGETAPLVVESGGTILRLLQARARSGFNPFDADDLRTLDGQTAARRDGGPRDGQVDGQEPGHRDGRGTDRASEEAGEGAGSGSSRRGASAMPGKGPGKGPGQGLGKRPGNAP